MQGAVDACDRCGESGHVSRKCPQTIQCHRCQQLGHIKRNCPVINCHLCEQPGHQARSCPNQLVPSGGGRSRASIQPSQPAQPASVGWGQSSPPHHEERQDWNPQSNTRPGGSAHGTYGGWNTSPSQPSPAQPSLNPSPAGQSEPGGWGSWGGGWEAPIGSERGDSRGGRQGEEEGWGVPFFEDVRGTEWRPWEERGFPYWWEMEEYLSKDAFEEAYSDVPVNCSHQKIRRNPHLSLNTEVVNVTLHNRVVQVTVTNSGREVGQWLEGQGGVTALGVDVEWRPNQFKGDDNPVTLLQIGGGARCVLVQLMYIDYVPRILMEFLAAPSIAKVGVGIVDDLKKLKLDYGLVCNGAVDIGKMAKNADTALKKTGLQSLSLEIAGYSFHKSRSASMSDWSRKHLSQKQVHYAANDAWASWLVYEALLSNTSSP